MDQANLTAVSMKNISKSFGSLHALKDVSFEAKYGEIHAILGENGAGKSTLMSILFGMLKADKGQIFVNDKEVHMKDANDATSLKIGMVHQHFKLVNDFTVYENIVLGCEETKGGVLKKKDSYKKIQDICSRYGISLSLDKKIRDISVGMQQRTEIVKVLFRDANILIFDEPTAVLTPQEIDSFIEILKNLKNENKAVILITHKLDEIKKSSDVVTVLRKGETIGTYDVQTTSTTEMASLMVGRQVNFKVDKKDSDPKEVVLDVKNLSCGVKHSRKKALDNVSLKVRAGEIVAIAGIEGNGQQELIDLICGMEKYPNIKGAIHLFDIGIPGNFHELTEKEYIEYEKVYDEYYDAIYEAKNKKAPKLEKYNAKIDLLKSEISATDNKEKLKELKAKLKKYKDKKATLLSESKVQEKNDLAQIEKDYAPRIKEVTEAFEKKKQEVTPIFNKNCEEYAKQLDIDLQTLKIDHENNLKNLKEEIKNLKVELDKTYKEDKKNFEAAYKKQRKTKKVKGEDNYTKKVLDRKALKPSYNEIFKNTQDCEAKLKEKKLALLDEKDNYRQAVIDKKNDYKYLKVSIKQANYINLLTSSLKEKRNHKVNIIPSDRQKDGLVLNFNIAYNLIITKFSKRPYSRYGILSSKTMNDTADRLIEKYDIRSSNGKNTRVGDMSGGNQQKVIIARETCDSPRLLIANQPTRGLDVGAIEAINKIIVEKRDAGAAVLLYSVELEDIMNLADRILVIHNGHISAELDPKKTSFEEIGLYMGGNNVKESDND